MSNSCVSREMLPGIQNPFLCLWIKKYVVYTKVNMVELCMDECLVASGHGRTLIL